MIVVAHTYGYILLGMVLMNTLYEDDTTISHVTRNDGFKTGLYALASITIAFLLVSGTIWLFVAS